MLLHDLMGKTGLAAVCLKEGTRIELTWEQIHSEANTIAKNLSAKRLENSVVCIQISRTNPHFLALFFGCARANVTMCFQSHDLTTPAAIELQNERNRFISEAVKPTLFISEQNVGDLLRPIEAELPITTGKTLIAYQCTGGTTKTKVVKLGHEMFVHEYKHYPEVVTPRKPVIKLCNTSFYWTASALGQISIALAFKAVMIMCEDGGNMESIRDIIRHEKCTMIGVAPDVLNLLAPHGSKDLPDVEVVFTWGEKFQVQILERWRNSKVQIRDLLISTEIWLTLYANPLTDRTLRKVSGVDILIIDDETKKQVPKGQRGRLLFALGSAVTPGYLEDHGEKTLEEIDGKKYWGTSDMVIQESTGLSFAGRCDMLAKDKGKFVDMTKVEEELMEFAIDEICTVFPDQCGSFHAFIKCANENVHAVKAKCPGILRLHIIDSPALPRHPVTNKIDRKKLLADYRPPPVSWPLLPKSEPDETTLDRLTQKWRRMTHWGLFTYLLVVAPGSVTNVMNYISAPLFAPFLYYLALALDDDCLDNYCDKGRMKYVNWFRFLKVESWNNMPFGRIGFVCAVLWLKRFKRTQWITYALTLAGFYLSRFKLSWIPTFWFSVTHQCDYDVHWWLDPRYWWAYGPKKILQDLATPPKGLLKGLKQRLGLLRTKTNVEAQATTELKDIATETDGIGESEMKIPVAACPKCGSRNISSHGNASFHQPQLFAHCPSCKLDFRAQADVYDMHSICACGGAPYYDDGHYPVMCQECLVRKHEQTVLARARETYVRAHGKGARDKVMDILDAATLEDLRMMENLQVQHTRRKENADAEREEICPEDPCLTTAPSSERNSEKDFHVQGRPVFVPLDSTAALSQGSQDSDSPSALLADLGLVEESKSKSNVVFLNEIPIVPRPVGGQGGNEGNLSLAPKCGENDVEPTCTPNDVEPRVEPPVSTVNSSTHSIIPILDRPGLLVHGPRGEQGGAPTSVTGEQGALTSIIPTLARPGMPPLAVSGLNEFVSAESSKPEEDVVGEPSFGKSPDPSLSEEAHTANDWASFKSAPDAEDVQNVKPPMTSLATDILPANDQISEPGVVAEPVLSTNQPDKGTGEVDDIAAAGWGSESEDKEIPNAGPNGVRTGSEMRDASDKAAEDDEIEAAGWGSESEQGSVDEIEAAGWGSGSDSDELQGSRTRSTSGPVEPTTKDLPATESVVKCRNCAYTQTGLQVGYCCIMCYNQAGFHGPRCLQKKYEANPLASFLDDIVDSDKQSDVDEAAEEEKRKQEEHVRWQEYENDWFKKNTKDHWEFKESDLAGLMEDTVEEQGPPLEGEYANALTGLLQRAGISDVGQHSVLSQLDSLRTQNLASWIRDTMGIRVSAADVLLCKNAAELTQLVSEAEVVINSGASSSSAPVEGDEDQNNGKSAEELYRVWFGPGQFTLMGSWVLRKDEKLDYEKLEQAAILLIQRHKALRAVKDFPTRVLSFVLDSAVLLQLSAPTHPWLRRLGPYFQDSWPAVSIVKDYKEMYKGRVVEFIDTFKCQRDMERGMRFRNMEKKDNWKGENLDLALVEMNLHLEGTYIHYYSRKTVSIFPSPVEEERKNNRMLFAGFRRVGKMFTHCDKEWKKCPHGCAGFWMVGDGFAWIRLDTTDRLVIYQTGSNPENPRKEVYHRASKEQGVTTVSSIHLRLNHAFGDAMSYYPLANDLLTFYQALVENRPPILSSPGRTMARMESRLLEAFTFADDGSVREENSRYSLRGSLFRYNGIGGYGYDMILQESASKAISYASKRYGVPTEVLLLAFVGASICKVKKVESWDFTLYVPCRDREGDQQGVGLFADWRDITFNASWEGTILGLIWNFHDKIKRREWTIFNCARKPERTYVNFQLADSWKRGSRNGFQQLHEDAWRHGETLYRTHEREGLHQMHQPMQFNIEQESELSWWVSMSFDYQQTPPWQCRAIVKQIKHCLWYLLFDPTKQLHEGDSAWHARHNPDE